MKHLLKGNPLVLAAASAILLLGIIGVVGWPLHIQGANAPDEPPVEERETRTFRDRDDKLAEIGTSVPGFGGMYLDPTNQSVLNVFLLDTADAAAAAEVQEAIAAKFPDAITPGGIAVVQGQYTINQLKSWYDDDLLPALGQSEMVRNGLTLTDLEEDKNRLEVGVKSPDLIPQVEKLVAGTGIPAGVVRITVRGPFRPFGGG